MSSVQDTMKCPQCGGCYVTDFNCRTFEEYSFCLRCGKAYTYKLIRDEKYNPILDENKKLQYTEKSKFGYGCLSLAYKNGEASLHSIAEPLTDEFVSNVRKSLENNEVDASRSYLTKWDDEKHDVVAVFGTVPKLYDEYFEDEDEPDEEQKTEGE